MSAADRLDEAGDLYAVREGASPRVGLLHKLARLLRAHPVLLDPTAEGRREALGASGERWVDQLVATDTCDPLERIRDELPGGARALLEVDGLGPKRVHTAWQLGLRDPHSLTAALQRGDLPGLPSADTLLPSLEAWRRRSRQVPWQTAKRISEELLDQLRVHPDVLGVVDAGAVRRGDPAVERLSIVVSTTAPLTPDGLLPDSQILPVDLHLTTPDARVATRLWHTGTRLHQLGVAAQARRRGLSWSEAGLRTADGSLVDLPDEHAFFAALDLPFIAPQLRMGTGEVQLAACGSLPSVLRASDLRGDLHTHSTWSDGRHSIEVMALAAQRAGLDYIAITDHTHSTAIAGGLSAEQLREQHQDWPVPAGITVLRGSECDILPDGTLDLPDADLASLDWVVGSMHSRLDLSADLQTERLIRAISTGLLDVVGHPTGRHIGRREGMGLHWKRVFAACRDWDVALEINGNPRRMDVEGQLARQAWDAGVRLVISTDAHAAEHVAVWEPGLQVALRAALPVEAIVNTRPWPVLAARRRARLARGGHGATDTRHDSP